MKEIIKKTCSRKKCYADRAKGDLLFCPECRGEFRDFVKLNGVEFVILPVEDEKILLEGFINT